MMSKEKAVATGKSEGVLNVKQNSIRSKGVTEHRRFDRQILQNVRYNLAAQRHRW